MNDNNSVKINFENLVSYTPSGMHVCRLTPPIHMTYASNGFCRMVGYTREEIEQKFNNIYIYTKMIHEDDRAAFVEHVHRLIEKPTKSTVEYRLLRKDGTLIYVSEIQESMYEGDILMGYADVTDISERKLNENLIFKEKNKFEELYRELKINNERFKFVSEHSGVMFYELDIVKKKYIMAENVYNILKYTNNEFLALLNEKIETISYEKYTTTIVHKDDIAVFDNATNELLNHNEAYCEVRICNSQGKYIWCAITRHLIREDDRNKLSVIGCIYNITQKYKEIESLKNQLNYDPNTGLLYEKPAKMLIEQILVSEPDSKHAMLLCEIKGLQTTGERVKNNNPGLLIANILKRIFQGYHSIIFRYTEDKYIVFIREALSEVVIKQKAGEVVNVINLELCTGLSVINAAVNIGIAMSGKIDCIFGDANNQKDYGK